MKEAYTTPELELVRFDQEDVITTSGVIGDPFELPVASAPDQEWN